MTHTDEQTQDSKEMRIKFEQILDRYNVKSEDKKELKVLSGHMWTFDDDY